MSCYGCGTSFSLFKKEHGCKNCGFAFCNSCLNKKIAVPKLKNEKHHVCNKCYNILTGKIKPQDDSGRYSPPEAYKKRVAALEEREKGGGSHGSKTHHTKPTGKPEYKHLAKPEREIQERLDKLKEDRIQKEKNSPSQKEIEERLSKLRGETAAATTASKKPTYQGPDRRTQQEQINDLLDEIGEEIEIDSHRPDPVKDIENRLAGLRGDPESDKPRNRESEKSSNNLNREDSQETVPFTKNIDVSNKTNTQTTDKRTNDEIPLEEMQRLIAEASKELDVDAQKALEDLQKDKEIMKRLQAVKNRKKEDVNKDTDEKSADEISDSDNENEETLTKNLIKQILEENKLDEAAAKDGVDTSETNSLKEEKNKTSSKDSKKSKEKSKSDKKSKKVLNTEPKRQRVEENNSDVDDDDELPYCVMCTEDATIRCHGCDLDLYCGRCWKESHVQFEMDDHVTSKYMQKKGRT